MTTTTDNRPVTLATVLTSLDGLTAAIHEASRRRRTLVSISAGVVVLLLGLVAFQITISSDNRATLKIVREVTDPQGKFAQRAQANQIAVVAQLAIEQDCREHRREAGMPPPTAALKIGDQTCVDQTPPEVYPGEVHTP